VTLEEMLTVVMPKATQLLSKFCESLSKRIFDRKKTALGRSFFVSPNYFDETDAVLSTVGKSLDKD